MQDVFKRLSRRENILLILLAASGLLGAVGIPQGLGFSSDQILLALLAVLALDTLIERLGYLDRIERSIASIDQRIGSRVSADRLLHFRSDMPRFDTQMKQTKEIWVLGKSAHGLLVDYTHQIREAIDAGKRFRFLVADPDNAAAMSMLAACSITMPDVRAATGLSQEALCYLGRLMAERPLGSVEVRLLPHVPTYGLAIFDGKQPLGEMNIELFGYKISKSERLHFVVTRSTSPSTFVWYLDQFERMWKDSQPWTAQSRSN